MRLIDANELKKRAKKLDSYAWTDFCSIVDEAPTIKAEPVKHGYWEESPTGNEIFNYCSVCDGAIQRYDNETFTYCPHCGARMDGAE